MHAWFFWSYHHCVIVSCLRCMHACMHHSEMSCSINLIELLNLNFNSLPIYTDLQQMLYVEGGASSWLTICTFYRGIGFALHIAILYRDALCIFYECMVPQVMQVFHLYVCMVVTRTLVCMDHAPTGIRNFLLLKMSCSILIPLTACMVNISLASVNVRGYTAHLHACMLLQQRFWGNCYISKSFLMLRCLTHMHAYTLSYRGSI